VDVINVVSIVAVAQVHQWIESNDDEAHGGLYWRQAFNLKTLELSVSCFQLKDPDYLVQIRCVTIYLVSPVDLQVWSPSAS
jgi:hypothetical protein